MSGGIDSSIAASLLVDKGFDVIGVTLQVWQDEYSQPDHGGCCSIDAVEDARRVAYQLGIPHYVLNYRRFFAQTVIADFVSEYRRGRTPNPCVRCNEAVKFGHLLQRLKILEGDYLATGHYAVIRQSSAANRLDYSLCKGVDADKDQSYALAGVRREALPKLLFPLGEMYKRDVKQLAADRGLRVAGKPESQEICFIPDNDYRRYLQVAAPEMREEGPIVDVRSGQELGRHEGIAFYTVGQRKGLGVQAPRPLYVTALDRGTNTVFVGSDQELYTRKMSLSKLNWLEEKRPLSAHLDVKIRYNTPASPATVDIRGDAAQVTFRESQRAITPGQAAVFYEGETVLGAGTIDGEENRLAACL